MAEIAQLESALIKADAAGDIESARVLAGEIRRMRGGEPRPVPFIPSGEKPQPTAMSEIFQNPNMPMALAANPATRLAFGSAKPLIGAGQIAANVAGVGAPVNQALAEFEQIKKEGRAAIGSTGFDWTEAAGTVFSPAFLKAAQSIPGGLTYLQKIMAGMGIGAAGGLTAPVTDNPASIAEFAKEKAKETGAGAALGGVVGAAAPIVEKTARGFYNALIEPLVNPAAIKGRAYLEAAGDKGKEILAFLKQNQEIVPGALPTAGEAAVPAARAEFSALQKSAAGVTPSEYLARGDAQNAARIAALRKIGQTPADIEGAMAVRKAAADPLYKAAREAGDVVDTRFVVAKLDAILSKNPGNRELVIELQNIKKGLLDENGNLRTNAQEVSSVLDGMKAALKDEKNMFIKGVLTDIKDALSKAIPGYEKAQAEFAKRSIPINQMQVGQELEKRLVPALSDEAKQKAATYASAIQAAPQTIKRATGAPRFEELSQVLNPRQLEVVNQIKDDLARGARFETMASKGAQAGPNAIDLATASMEKAVGGKVPNPLNRHVMVFNQILMRLEGKINKKLAAEVSVEMLNPPKVAESLMQAKFRESRNAVIAKYLENLKLGTIGAAAQQQNQ